MKPKFKNAGTYLESKFVRKDIFHFFFLFVAIKIFIPFEVVRNNCTFFKVKVNKISIIQIAFLFVQMFDVKK